MTKINFIFFLCFFAVTELLGQQKSDTLFFGDKKIILQRTKTFLSYNTSVSLPTEYKELKNEVSFNYNQRSDLTYNISYDEDENQITTSILAPKDSCKSLNKEKLIYYLNSFVDTIKINVKEFGKQIPYIKSKGKKIYFCSAKIDVDLNDTIYSVVHDPVTKGNIFSHWDDDYRWGNDYKAIEMNYIERKKAKYILRDLYYRKGEATYHFDRTFVIILY